MGKREKRPLEGTLIRSSRPKGVNEYELEKEIAKHVKSTDGLVLASFSPQHVDRLVGFIRAA
jgi:ribonuclease J